MPDPQRFSLEVAGHGHEVEIAQRGVRREVVWRYDGEPVATRVSAGDTVRLGAKAGVPAEAGSMVLRFTTLGRPRRVTWRAPDDGPLAGHELDLDPDAGSRAAAYVERQAAHPVRFTILATSVGVVRVVLPILLSLVAIRFAVSLPWPDLPSIDLPDVQPPSIPWPDLPSIPWPDWTLPGWLAWALEHVHYVWPVVLAFVLARAELRRRRTQEERKAALRDDS